MKVSGIETTVHSGNTISTVDNAIQTTKAATDEFSAIDLSKTKIWGGSKGTLAECAFEINGEKFVFVDKGKVTENSLALLAEAGIAHYVEVGTAGSVGGADAKAMTEKISMATGLKVETGTVANSVWTKDTTPGTSTKICLQANTTNGSATGGLTLQIGDTAESFNQLTVGINDCYTDTMGIGSISIASQEGAAATMSKIKNAINYVSDVRGTLGATQNHLNHTINNLSVMQENIQDAESTIRILMWNIKYPCEGGLTCGG